MVPSFKHLLARQDDEGLRLSLLYRTRIPTTSNACHSDKDVCAFFVSFHCYLAKMEDTTTSMAATLASRYTLSKVRSGYYFKHFTNNRLQAPTSTATHSGTLSPALRSYVLAASSKTIPKYPTRISKSPQVGTSGCAALDLTPLHYQNKYEMFSANLI